MASSAVSLPSQAFAAAIGAAEAAANRFNSVATDLEARDPAAYKEIEEAMLAASRAADAAIPVTWDDFARWVEHVMDAGLSGISEANESRLLAHTRRLVVEAR